MKVEDGKRYRLIPKDGGAPREGTVQTFAFMGFRAFILRTSDGQVRIDDDGRCPEGHLVEVDDAPPPPLRPVFGHDAGEFARMQRRFETWDFRTGT